uniref:CWC16 protein n=1 Tax=Theileria annulata TaxID=5874 RepID=A0A3B0N6B5_THEAN
MSTLKAARADNFYFPPDQEDAGKRFKKRRVGNRRDGGDERRGPIIRFEMPFKVICLDCGAYIAKGVRFDAEKKCVGKYYTTDIYAFKMACFKCFRPIVIQTDPEHTDYICKEGVRKKIELRDESRDDVITVGKDNEMRDNALYILEKRAEETQSIIGKEVGKEVSQDVRGETNEIIDDRKQIEYLEDLSESRSKDSYLANCALRRKFRTQKKLMEKETHTNFSLPLLRPTTEDLEESKKITFITESKKLRSHFKRLVGNDDIFSKGSVKTASTISVPNSLESKKKKLQFIKYLDSKSKYK